MPAKIVTAAVPMRPNSIAQFNDLANQFFFAHFIQIIIHSILLRLDLAITNYHRLLRSGTTEKHRRLSKRRALTTPARSRAGVALLIQAITGRFYGVAGAASDDGLEACGATRRLTPPTIR